MIVRVEALRQRNVWLLGFVQQTAAAPPFFDSGRVIVIRGRGGGGVGGPSGVPGVLHGACLMVVVQWVAGAVMQPRVIALICMRAGSSEQLRVNTLFSVWAGAADGNRVVILQRPAPGGGAGGKRIRERGAGAPIGVVSTLPGVIPG